MEKKKKISSASGIGKVGQPYVNYCSENTCLHHTQGKKRSKWVKDLHIGYNTIKLLKFWERWSGGVQEHIKNNFITFTQTHHPNTVCIARWK